MSVRPRFRLLPSRSERWLEIENHRPSIATEDGPVEVSVYEKGRDTMCVLLTLGEVAELSAVCQIMLGDLTPEDVLRHHEADD